MDEKVLVVKRKQLFGENDEHSFQGFKHIRDKDFLQTINGSGSFIWRKTSPDQEMPAEKDIRFKQIITYAVFVHAGKMFLYRRKKGSGEQRLHDLHSIGIGGHINPDDNLNDIVVDGLKREFHEELTYSHDYKVHPIGFINQDHNDVGQVHFGVVFVIEGDSPEIGVHPNEAHKIEGSLIPLEDVLEKRELMEDWSKAALDAVVDWSKNRD